MVLVLFAVVGATVATAVATLRMVATVDSRHVELGLFGAGPREEHILATADVVISVAERVERLHYFRAALQTQAFRGTLLAVTPAGGNWRAWQFADGERWQVEELANSRRHSHRRRGRRLVVGGDGAADGDTELNVHAYEPGGVDVDLCVRDARLVG